jgi:3-hydroxypropanoate dehydrogenase
MIAQVIAGDALAQIFTRTRTQSTWSPKPIPVSTLKQMYDLAKLGPTSANCSLMRLVFVTSQAVRERLLPALSKKQQKKSASASVVESSRRIGTI